MATRGGDLPADALRCAVRATCIAVRVVCCAVWVRRSVPGFVCCAVRALRSVADVIHRAARSAPGVAFTGTGGRQPGNGPCPAAGRQGAPQRPSTGTVGGSRGAAGALGE